MATEKHGGHTGRMPCSEESKGWNYTVVSQGLPKMVSEPPEGKGKKGFSPTGFIGSMGLPTP